MQDLVDQLVVGEPIKLHHCRDLLDAYLERADTAARVAQLA